MFMLFKHTKICEVKEAWNILYHNNEKLSPYQEFSYCSNIEKYPFYVKRYGLKNIIYELRDKQGQTVLLIPLHLKNTREHTLAYLWGQFSNSCHLDFIYDNRIQTETLLSALKLITDDISNIRFVFTRIQEKSKLNEMLSAKFPSSRYNIRKSVCIKIPVFRNYDEYIKSLRKNARQHLRSSFNHLRTDNRTYEMKTFVNQPIPPDILIRLFKILSKRRSETNTPMGLNRFLPVFLRIRLSPTINALTKLTNTFYSIIYIDNKIAGFCAGFTYRHETILLPYLAINTIFSRYSPGGILITQTLKYLIENHDYKYLDLSIGDERYKYAYGGKEYFHYSYEFYSAGGDFKLGDYLYSNF